MSCGINQTSNYMGSLGTRIFCVGEKRNRWKIKLSENSVILNLNENYQQKLTNRSSLEKKQLSQPHTLNRSGKSLSQISVLPYCPYSQNLTEVKQGFLEKRHITGLRHEKYWKAWNILSYRTAKKHSKSSMIVLTGLRHNDGLEPGCIGSLELIVKYPEFSDSVVKVLVVWDQPCRENLHQGNWQMLHITTLFLPLSLRASLPAKYYMEVSLRRPWWTKGRHFEKN